MIGIINSMIKRGNGFAIVYYGGVGRGTLSKENPRSLNMFCITRG